MQAMPSFPFLFPPFDFVFFFFFCQVCSIWDNTQAVWTFILVCLDMPPLRTSKYSQTVNLSAVEPIVIDVKGRADKVGSHAQ